MFGLRLEQEIINKTTQSCNKSQHISLPDTFVLFRRNIASNRHCFMHHYLFEYRDPSGIDNNMKKSRQH